MYLYSNGTNIEETLRHEEQPPRYFKFLAKSPKWVVVLDNLDPHSLGEEPWVTTCVKRLATVIDEDKNLLVTTRHRYQYHETFGEEAHVELQTFSAIESMGFLQQYLTPDFRPGINQWSYKDLFKLAHKTKGLPLSLASAASFIQTSGTTANDFFQRMEIAGPDAHTHDATFDKIWTTALQDLSGSAFDLLMTVADFGCDAIPELLLQTDASGHRRSQEDFNELEIRCLIFRGEKRTVTCQRAVQAILVRSRATGYDREQRMIEAAQILARQLSEIEKADDYTVDRATQIAERIIDEECLQIREHQSTVKAPLLLAVGRLVSSGTKSIKYVSIAYEIYVKRLGEEHPVSIDVLHLKAKILLDRAYPSEAASDCLKAIASAEKVYGTVHSRTFAIKQDLARAYERQGLFKKAIDVLSFAFKIHIEVLGLAHPDTITCRSQLASVMLAAGDFQQAEVTLSEIIPICEQVLGQNHPDTLTNMNNLVSSSISISEPSTVLRLAEETLFRSKTSLGPQHPNTLTSMMNLACIFLNVDMLDRAEDVGRQALILSESIGRDDQKSIILFNLAKTLHRSGRVAEATALYKNALDMLLKTLGRLHAMTISCMCSLAMLLEERGEYNAAIPLVQQICEALTETKGAVHSMTLEWKVYHQKLGARPYMKSISERMSSLKVKRVVQSVSESQTESNQEYTSRTQIDSKITIPKRLLHQRADGTINIEETTKSSVSRYAVLSHAWGNDEDEPTYQDVKERSGQHKIGYQKIFFCANNFSELSEAIISMYQWYTNAIKCCVYLSDVRATSSLKDSWTSQLRHSRWFTRGWTLQELLVPQEVKFYSTEGAFLGTKRSLERRIRDTTSTSVSALRGMPLSEFSITERLSWFSRQVKLPEDEAYCMMGIFDVYMPLLYGEGEFAFKRLINKVQQHGFGDGKFVHTAPRGERDQGDACEEPEADLCTALESLAFPEMSETKSRIVDPFPHSCEWIFGINEYRSWISKSHEMLWITGKPGAGKSALVKFLSNTIAETQGKESNDVPNLLLEFFFNTHGAELQRTFTGLLRSLLFQLASHNVSVRRKVYAAVTQKKPLTEVISHWEWNDIELEILLIDGILATAQTRAVVIFVDGVDEADRTGPTQTVRYLIRLHERASKEDCPIKICIASRPFPIAKPENTLPIVIDDHNADDIAFYVDEILQSNQIAADDDWQQLRNELVKRAHGIFLWAAMTAQRVRKGMNDGSSPHDIRQMMQQIPSELQSVYARILSTIDDANRPASIRLFQWVLLLYDRSQQVNWHMHFAETFGSRTTTMIAWKMIYGT